ncbi:hypothetical protein FVE85_4462 [Porphyridium purpureum]|uniref:Uncharacterized protein n=1 Tax=Porphyridium purpureum TaxID=35688 RepID=A0A5J4YIS1_PORPP|nr:hypothetical protein FVE85_4462 [Porphyridium purpureum]|eukprot:POR9513..scf297_16
MSTATELLHVRVLVLGDEGVGKNTLAHGLCAHPTTSKARSHRRSKSLSISKSLLPTSAGLNVGAMSAFGSGGSHPAATDEMPRMRGCEVYYRLVHMEGRDVALSFWVLEPSPRYEYSRDFWLRCCAYDGVLLLYDLFSQSSRRSVRRIWLPLLVHFEAAYETEEAHHTVASRIAYEDMLQRSSSARALSRRRREEEERDDQGYARVGNGGGRSRSGAYHAFNRLFSASFDFSYARFAQLCRAVLEQILAVCRVLLSYVLSSDDLLSVAEERRLIRLLRKRGALLGSKQDLYSGFNRTAQQRQHKERVEHFPHILLDCHHAQDNARLSAFLRQLVEQRVRKAAVTAQDRGLV